MTTKPKVRKFRIRRSSPLATGTAEVEDAGVEPQEAAQPVRAPDMSDDILQKTPAPAPDHEVDSPAKPEETSPDDAMTALRKEGLTGRQLRMARRLAQKHDLSPSTDFEAVLLLRAKGIDPFERANMLELVVPQQGSDQPNTGRVQLPQTRQPDHMPSTQVGLPTSPGPLPDPRATRAQEIQSIQRDISRRRRRKMALLFSRLAFLVGLPTLLAGYYFFVIATPMYATKSEFVIQQADSQATGGLGGLFSGTGFATSQDSIAVQSYLMSRDAMLRLDRDLGFKAHFANPEIDAIQRLPENPTNEQAYKVFSSNVEIGYDPSEGIIKMEVVAASPEVSAEWSEKLIEYAEEQVDNLTQRLRADQMQGAMTSFEQAEEKMMNAQRRVLELQEQLGVLDPTAETGGVMTQITTFEVQLAEKRLQLQQLLDNRRPNQARVDGVRGDISRLQDLIAALRGQLTDNTGTTSSLASISGELRMAEVDLQTRTLLMQQSLQQLETARIEANRQTRYLSMGVTPIPPDEATYPRAFENTLLAFLIFAGIYLLISLTASILREQVSA
ncbi:capsule biosynthesis protein [Oceaniglobus ichthyenteri]|uniref:capsule biosynthesis protein n=1 Tax=Oceaniglobus ichthyenteri TaxID=2136177 RepID=UPI000D3A2F71|nr:capsule biosynthesis protein [Oceaniglobus ichthyenteri]